MMIHLTLRKEKIKESKLLIDELDLPGSSDFFPSPECDSVFYEVDVLSSTNNGDKVFNTGILIHGNLFEVTIRATPDKNVKKIDISNASLILEDFNPPLYELPFHKEVLRSETLLSFSSENEEKVFNPEILTSKGVHTSLLSELSHRDTKAFKATSVHDDVGVSDDAADENAKDTSVCNDIDEAHAAADDNEKATSVHDDVGVPDATADDNAKSMIMQ
ncbi:hypothetical protein Tco_1159209, partial [Tanacetum coccineum]